MKTPLEYNELSKAPNADSNCNDLNQANSANSVCINTRRRVGGACAFLAFLALAGAPQKAQALPPSEPIRDTSGLTDLSSFRSLPDAGELSKMSWEEVKAQLDKMNTSDILDFMGSIAEVIEDFKKTFRSDLHKKLLDRDLQAAQPDSKVLEDDEKQFLLEMAQKYNIDNFDLFVSVLNKQNYSERDCKFLFLAFRKIVSTQHNFLTLYIKMREWVVNNRADDSDDSRARYLRDNPESLSYFMQMEMLMARFEKRLISE